MNNSYVDAGITSIADFYKDKFAYDKDFNFSKNTPISFYDIEYYKLYGYSLTSNLIPKS